MGCLLGPASPPGKPKIPPGRPSLALSPSHLFHPLCRRCPPINFHHQPACIAMGRPRKDDKQKETAELMISVEDFARTRDSVSRALFCNARPPPTRAVPTPYPPPNQACAPLNMLSLMLALQSSFSALTPPKCPLAHSCPRHRRVKSAPPWATCHAGCMSSSALSHPYSRK